MSAVLADGYTRSRAPGASLRVIWGSVLVFAALGVGGALGAEVTKGERARVVNTAYTAQKVVFDFYLDDPAKMGSALHWVRALMNPLLEEPYRMAPEELSLKVVIHGTEIVTVAQKNHEKYKELVDRMRYYASLGVEFKVCGMAAHDYGYRLEDLYDFVEVVPSAITELAHWQLQGYALITPQILSKKLSIEEIR